MVKVVSVCCVGYSIINIAGHCFASLFIIFLLRGNIVDSNSVHFFAERETF